MSLPLPLSRLPLPIIASPLFIISNPKLVIEQCKAGVVGSMPALNARPASQLDEWLAEITEALAAYDCAHPDRPAAPFAINQIVHRSNDRMEQDMALCEKYKVPIVITSLGARTEVNDAVHNWGGVVLHDIIGGSGQMGSSCLRARRHPLPQRSDRPHLFQLPSAQTDCR
jgi:nitronate monooxygenase